MLHQHIFRLFLTYPCLKRLLSKTRELAAALLCLYTSIDKIALLPQSTRSMNICSTSSAMHLTNVVCLQDLILVYKFDPITQRTVDPSIFEDFVVPFSGLKFNSVYSATTKATKAYFSILSLNTQASVLWATRQLIRFWKELVDCDQF